MPQRPKHPPVGTIVILLCGAVITTVLTLVGCAASGEGLKASVAAKQSQLDADVDTALAYVPLAKIKPAVSRPERTSSTSPISDRAAAQIAKAETLIAEQRYTEAAIQLERALRYDPGHPLIQRTLAMLHWDAGNVERARIHTARALENDKDDALSHYVRGRCAALANDATTAITAFRTALLCSNFGDSGETGALCHYHLARQLTAAGYLTAALGEYEAFETSATALPMPSARGELATLVRTGASAAAQPRARILERLGRYADAAAVVAALAAGSPGDVGLALRHATLLTKAGRLDDALAAAREIESDRDDVLDLLFSIHEESGHPERIVDDLRARIAKRPGEVRLLLNLSEKLTQLGRTREARDALTGYLDQHPDASEVRMGVLDVLLAEQNYALVLALCVDGVQQNPTMISTFANRVTDMASIDGVAERLLELANAKDAPEKSYLLSVLAAANAQTTRAKLLLERAIADGFDEITGRVALARILVSEFDYDEALRVANRKDENQPEDTRLEMILGQVFDRLDAAKTAELHFRAAERMDRDDPAPILALATLYERTNELARAQRQLRVLLERDPDNEQAREQLAGTYIREGKLDVAVAEFEELVRRATTPLVKARCSALLKQIRNPDIDTLRSSLIAAVEQYGHDALTWNILADSYDVDTQAEERLEAYRAALAHDPNDEDAAVGVFESTQKMLLFEESAEVAVQLLRRRPNRHSWRLGYTARHFSPPIRRYGLIELYQITENYAAAMAAANFGEEHPELAEKTRHRYRRQAIQTLRQAGRDDEAITQLEAWVADSPDNTSLASMLAAEYQNSDRHKEAVALIRKLQEQDPENRSLIASLMSALVAADEHERAEQHVLDLLRMDPDDDNTVSQLVWILNRSGQVDEALEIVRNRLPRTRNRERFQNLTISLLAEAKRLDDAGDYVDLLTDEVMTLLRDAHDGKVKPVRDDDVAANTARRPNEPFTTSRLYDRLFQLRMSYSGILISQEHFRAATQSLTEWLEASQNQGERFEYLRRLAICQQGLGNGAEATKSLSRALVLNPTNLTMNNDVAYGWIDLGIRIAEAEPMIRYAVSRAPQQSSYLDTYGWLLYKKGDFAASDKWLRRADRRREGKDPVIKDHLGDLAWRRGQKTEAVDLWQAALDSLEARPDGRTLNADERRVREHTAKKAEAARTDGSPKIAPLALVETHAPAEPSAE